MARVLARKSVIGIWVTLFCLQNGGSDILAFQPARIAQTLVYREPDEMALLQTSAGAASEKKVRYGAYQIKEITSNMRFKHPEPAAAAEDAAETLAAGNAGDDMGESTQAGNATNGDGAESGNGTETAGNATSTAEPTSATTDDAANSTIETMAAEAKAPNAAMKTTPDVVVPEVILTSQTTATLSAGMSALQGTENNVEQRGHVMVFAQASKIRGFVTAGGYSSKWEGGDPEKVKGQTFTVSSYSMGQEEFRDDYDMGPTARLGMSQETAPQGAMPQAAGEALIAQALKESNIAQSDVQALMLPQQATDALAEEDIALLLQERAEELMQESAEEEFMVCNLPKLIGPSQVIETAVGKASKFKQLAVFSADMKPKQVTPGTKVRIKCEPGFTPKFSFGKPPESACVTRNGITDLFPPIDPAEVKCFHNPKCANLLVPEIMCHLGPSAEVEDNAVLAAPDEGPLLCASTFHRTDEDIFSMKGIVMRTGSHFVQTTASSFERFRGTKQCGELALDSDSAWCFSRDKNLEHVIKVDLGKPMRVVGIATQGMELSDSYFSNYRLSLSEDDKSWIITTACQGNVNDQDKVYNVLSRPLKARYVKIEGIKWHGDPVLRLGVLAQYLMDSEDADADATASANKEDAPAPPTRKPSSEESEAAKDEITDKGNDESSEADGGDNKVLRESLGKLCTVSPPDKNPVVAAGQKDKSGEGMSQLNAPEGIALDSSGNLYVADSNNGRIMKFEWDSKESKFAALGLKVAGDLRLPNVILITSADKSAIVSTRLGIYKYRIEEDSGMLAGGLRISSKKTVVSMALDGNGNLFVMERTVKGAGSLSKLMKNGLNFDTAQQIAISVNITKPGGIAFLKEDLFFVDSAASVVYKAPKEDGRFAKASVVVGVKWKPGACAKELLAPTAIAFNGNGDMFVADSGNDRIQKYVGCSVEHLCTAQGSFNPKGTTKMSGGLLPMGLAARNEDQRLYVVLKGASFVQTIIMDKIQKTATSKDEEDEKFNQEEGGRSEEVSYITMANSQIDPPVTTEEFQGILGDFDTAKECLEALQKKMEYDYALYTSTDKKCKAYLLQSPHRKFKSLNHATSFRKKPKPLEHQPIGSVVAGMSPETPRSTGLKNPEGVCQNAYGDLIVADTGHHRVVKFPKKAGSGDRFELKADTIAAGLKRPNVVAVHPDGHLYVSDLGDPTAAACGESGKLVKYNKVPSRNLYELKSKTLATKVQLQDFTFDEDGTLYTIDMCPGNKPQLKKLLKEGTDAFIALTPAFKLINPVSIVSHQRGGGKALFVADEGAHCVIKFPLKDGELTKNFEVVAGKPNKPGRLPGQLHSPNAVTLDAVANVLVADTGNDRILKFSLNQDFGGYETTGTKVARSGWQLSSMTAGDSSMFVADMKANWVSKIDLRGKKEHCAVMCAMGAMSDVPKPPSMSFEKRPKPMLLSKGPCNLKFMKSLSYCKKGPPLQEGDYSVHCGCDHAYAQVDAKEEALLPGTGDECTKFYKKSASSTDRELKGYTKAWLKKCAPLEESYDPYAVQQFPKPAPEGSAVEPSILLLPSNSSFSSSLKIVPRLGMPDDPTLAWISTVGENDFLGAEDCNMVVTSGLAWCASWAPWQLKLARSARGPYKCGCSIPYQHLQLQAISLMGEPCIDPLQDYTTSADMQRRIKYGLRKWMKACFGSGREPPRAHQNYVGESESQNPAQLESEISVHPIDSFKADSFQKRFDLGEKLANETPYEEEAAAEAGMGPDPPAWFRWSPAMEGGMWPKKMDFQATVGNTSDCKASFWYGVAYCAKGEKEWANVTGITTNDPKTRVSLGFGCAQGARVKSTVQGSTPADPLCMESFIEWDKQMQNKVAKLDEPLALYKAFHKEIFRAYGFERPAPTHGKKQCGPDLRIDVQSEKCKVSTIVMAGICNTAPHTYIPIRFWRSKPFVAYKVGCGCGESISDAQVFGGIEWMKDRSPTTQNECMESYLGFMSEVQGALSGAPASDLSPKYLNGTDRIKLEAWSKHYVNEPRTKALQQCARMKRMEWQPKSIANNLDQVYTKVNSDEAEFIMRDQEKSMKVKKWKEERASKKHKWSVERINKEKNWADEKAEKEGKRVKMSKKEARETRKKSRLKQGRAAKLVRKEQKAKLEVKNAKTKQAAEIAEKHAATAQREKVEMRQKSERAAHRAKAKATLEAQALAKEKSEKKDLKAVNLAEIKEKQSMKVGQQEQGIAPQEAEKEAEKEAGNAKEEAEVEASVVSDEQNTVAELPAGSEKDLEQKQLKEDRESAQKKEQEASELEAAAQNAAIVAQETANAKVAKWNAVAEKHQLITGAALRLKRRAHEMKIKYHTKRSYDQVLGTVAVYEAKLNTMKARMASADGAKAGEVRVRAQVRGSIQDRISAGMPVELGADDINDLSH